MARVTVKIDKRTGQMAVDGQEFSGATCDLALNPFRDLLAANAYEVSEERKPEYYATEGGLQEGGY